jgi:transcriptional regulator GlxA family with amidase domain
MTVIEDKMRNKGRNFPVVAVKDYGNGAIHRIDQSITYMAQHLDKPLQVATLAAQANVSPSHFFALFRRRIGSAPMDYFTRLRMQCACRMLERTSLSVKEVASALGYDDPFYFSRVFKSVNQMAPSNYRTAQQEAGNKVGDKGRIANFPGANPTQHEFQSLSNSRKLQPIA